MLKIAARFALSTGRGARRVLRFLSLHRHNVAQHGGAAVIVVTVSDLYLHFGLVIGSLWVICTSVIHEQTGGDSGTW